MFNHNLQTWDSSTLSQLLGTQAAEAIEREHSCTILRQGFNDKLIFTWAANGEFCVKRAYQMLMQLRVNFNHMQSDLEKIIWKTIWHAKGVLPRVRMFMWKAMHDVLPVGLALHKCIQQISSIYKLCGANEEDIMHVLFHCPHARATWFQSTLGLRVDHFRGMNLREVLHVVWQPLDLHHISLFFSTAWHIWKARCARVFNNKETSPRNTLGLTQAPFQSIYLIALPSVLQ